MNEITINLQTFSKIIKDNYLNTDIVTPNFKLIFQKYQESLGGCNCSKAGRINAANTFYKLTLTALKTDDFINLKKFLNVEKIKFENNLNQIFLEV